MVTFKSDDVVDRHLELGNSNRHQLLVLDSDAHLLLLPTVLTKVSCFLYLLKRIALLPQPKRDASL